MSLFHELAHAYRGVTGTTIDGNLSEDEVVKVRNRPVKGDIGQPREEYLVTGLFTFNRPDGTKFNPSPTDRLLTENQYLAERSAISLSNHRDVLRDDATMAHRDYYSAGREAWTNDLLYYPQ